VTDYTTLPDDELRERLAVIVDYMKISLLAGAFGFEVKCPPSLEDFQEYALKIAGLRAVGIDGDPRFNEMLGDAIGDAIEADLEALYERAGDSDYLNDMSAWGQDLMEIDGVDELIDQMRELEVRNYEEEGNE